MTSKESTFMQEEYGILQVIPCHKEDIRAVCSYPGGSLITASRDQTSKLFKPDDSTNPHSELVEIQNFFGPTGFVSAACCGRTKSGELEIFIASHDNIIYIYTLLESEPIATLNRHSGPVCTVAFRVCNDEDVLVSGSWDNTAIIWRDRLPVATLIGHVHAVWDVAFVARSFILTAGADKTIRKWDVTNGQLLNIFEGHTDCVRGLAVISGTRFLSCSNDATLILWSIEGDILQRFEGHENFIYSVCIVREPLRSGEEPPKNRPYKIVSVSEDKTVRIWDKDSGMLQKIPLQATTLWSVAALDNGNFVVGTSDGHAYVFSTVTLAAQSQN